MHIAHYIPARLPASRYGGSERVAYGMAREQARAGHTVTFLSHAGSQVPFGHWSQLPVRPVEWAATLQPKRFDIVHFHSLPPPTFPADFPHLLTVHGNGKPGEVFPKNSVFVSADHARRHGSAVYVYNGIPLEEYALKACRVSQGNAMFLAKASWRVKNLRGSIKIAAKAGKRLLVAGGRRPLEPWGFFATHARFYGKIDDREKIELLHRSDALLFPVLWSEPFGLAVIEALACGVPVIASAFGSLPEIVTPDCGLTSVSTDEMADFLSREVMRISPEACRARVENRFSSTRMAERYLELYARVVSGESLNPEFPRASLENPGCTLDPKSDVFRSR